MKWSSAILAIAVAVATTASGTMAASGTTYASGTIVTTAAPKTTTVKATTAAPATIITIAAPATIITTAAPATIITTAAPKTTTVKATTAAPATTPATTTTVKATTAAPATIITTAAPKTTTVKATTAAPVTTPATTTTVKATTTAPVTTPATTTTTKAPLMPGLHPTGSHSCQVNEIPTGAYQVQKQMPDGSVQMYHYLVCSAASSTYRGALVGTATTRAATCPASAPLYAGFGAGKGPCAPLAAGRKMTTTCKNGDNQGRLPAALPQNYIRYIGCGGIPGDKDYALTSYTTSNSGFREELQAVKCCKVVPA